MPKRINKQTEYYTIQLLKLSTLKNFLIGSIKAALVQLVQSSNQESKSLGLITAVNKDS